MNRINFLFLFFTSLSAMEKMENPSSFLQNVEINSECEILEQKIERDIHHLISFIESLIFAKFTIATSDANEEKLLIFNNYQNSTIAYGISLSEAHQRIEELSNDSCDQYSIDASKKIKILLDKLSFEQERLKLFLKKADLLSCRSKKIFCDRSNQRNKYIKAFKNNSDDDLKKILPRIRANFLPFEEDYEKSNKDNIKD